MGAITQESGNGLSDSADKQVTLDVGEDVFSNVKLQSSSTYVSGGFDSLGNGYGSRPIAISDVTVVLGRNGSANVGVRPIFKTDFYGNPALTSTTTVFTGSLAVNAKFLLSTESSYFYPTFATTNDVYIGFEGVTISGSIDYGRGGLRGDVWEGTSRITNEDKLSGTYTQISIPSPPLNPNVISITDTTANIIWSAPTDDGIQSPAAYSASNIKGYRINYRNSSLENWKVLVANTGSNSLFRVVTELVPSTYYEVEVAALNVVTDAHNPTYSNITAHVGVRSVTKSFTTGASTNHIKISDGSTFKKSILKVWDGSAWLEYPDITVKVWNGSAFKDVALDS
jgi:hypothetical protein